MITSNPPRLILSFFSTESAFKVLGATETAATTRDVKENPVPANRASRFYPGRNHDCSRRDSLLAALAMPGMLRARKRAQASRVKDDLRLIEGAVDQYAIETQRQSDSVVSVADWTAYLKQ